MPEAAKTAVQQELVDIVVTPRTMKDVPVIGGMFTTLASLLTKVSEEDMLMLSNAFQESGSGKLSLKLHNPFVETAIFNVIQPELKRLIVEAATEKKRQEEEKKASKKS